MTFFFFPLFFSVMLILWLCQLNIFFYRPFVFVSFQFYLFPRRYDFVFLLQILKSKNKHSVENKWKIIIFIWFFFFFQVILNFNFILLQVKNSFPFWSFFFLIKTLLVCFFFSLHGKEINFQRIFYSALLVFLRWNVLFSRKIIG